MMNTSKISHHDSNFSWSYCSSKFEVLSRLPDNSKNRIFKMLQLIMKWHWNSENWLLGTVLEADLKRI